MDRKRVVLIGLAVLLVLGATGSAAASILALEVERHVIAGGGGHVEAGDYALDATIGQPVAGTVSMYPYDLCAGFWCGRRIVENIYIPIVLRNG